MLETESSRLGKLLTQLSNPSARALDEAAGLAISRTHHEIGIEHWLLKLIDGGDGDIPLLLRHFRIDVDRVWSALVNNLDNHCRTGNLDTPGLSSALVDLLEEARRFCLVDLDSATIRSGALLFAMLSMRGYRLPQGLQVLDNIPLAMLRREFLVLTAKSEETCSISTAADTPSTDGDANDIAAESGPESSSHRFPASASTSPNRVRAAAALRKYTVDLTQKARDGELDPVHGRDAEIRQMIDILSRRRKNNPILVGEPGVGKTAIVEGLALQIAHGLVPAPLRAVELRALDLGLLQAGASMRGEFESRLRAVVDEVKASGVPIMLFIDEAHTLVGAGERQGGAGDAANLLKPALARGELRTIAATTWSEYKQYFERDAALDRRFQMVKVEEPDESAAASMLRGLKAAYEAFHGVTITDDAILAAVRLSKRYIPARQLPDKAVDLIDTASARVKSGRTAIPAALASVSNRIDHLRREHDALQRDLHLGSGVASTQIEARVADIAIELQQLAARQAALQRQHECEAALLAQLHEAGAMLHPGRGASATAPRPAGERERIRRLRAELAALQGEAPLMHLEVDANTVAQVVADWTGVPAARMLKDEMASLLTIEQRLRERVVGQDDGVALLAEGLRNARLGLRKKEAPLGVFLLVGPSGVGKTETALALADQLFGGERSLTTINMSEYQEAHTVSQLKGSPPGYVGYGQGGVLTEAVRQRPYGVVLLDEVEKAHRDVLNLFYQVFDRGFMRDGEGREIDFTNCVILLTSNLGSDSLMDLWDQDQALDSARALEEIRPELLAHFQPALLARMQVVPYLPLDRACLMQIVGLKLERLGQRLQQTWRIALHHTEALRDLLAGECNTPDSGARAIDRLIEQTLMPAISRELLVRLTRDALPAGICLSAGAQSGLDIDYVDTADEFAALRTRLDAASTEQLARRGPEPPTTVPLDPAVS